MCNVHTRWSDAFVKMTAAIVSTFVWLVSREDKNRQETSDEGYTMQHRPSPEQLLHIQPNTCQTLTLSMNAWVDVQTSRCSIRKTLVMAINQSVGCLFHCFALLWKDYNITSYPPLKRNCSNPVITLTYHLVSGLNFNVSRSLASEQKTAQQKTFPSACAVQYIQ